MDSLEVILEFSVIFKTFPRRKLARLTMSSNEGVPNDVNTIDKDGELGMVLKLSAELFQSHNKEQLQDDVKSQEYEEACGIPVTINIIDYYQ